MTLMVIILTAVCWFAIGYSVRGIHEKDKHEKD